MIEYEVGEIPDIGLGIEVRDLADNPISTLGYSSVDLQILDPGNRPLDTSDVTISAVPSAAGAYVVTWPRTHSMFREAGTYLVRLVLHKSDGSLVPTRPTEINVRDFGRLPRQARRYTPAWEVN